MSAAQYTVAWHGAPLLLSDPISWKEAALRKEAEKERPTDPHAPWSGAWWSIPVGLASTGAQKAAVYPIAAARAGP